MKSEEVDDFVKDGSFYNPMDSFEVYNNAEKFYLIDAMMHVSLNRPMDLSGVGKLIMYRQVLTIQNTIMCHCQMSILFHALKY